MKHNNQKGFTLIELILVITVLGILAVAALPNFIDVTTQADISAQAGVVGGVNAALALQYADFIANGVAQTGALDAAGTCDTVAGGCFDTILQAPITSASWTATATGWDYTDTAGVTTSYTFAAGTAVAAGNLQ